MILTPDKTVVVVASLVILTKVPVDYGKSLRSSETKDCLQTRVRLTHFNSRREKQYKTSGKIISNAASLS